MLNNTFLLMTRHKIRLATVIIIQHPVLRSAKTNR